MKTRIAMLAAALLLPLAACGSSGSRANAGDGGSAPSIGQPAPGAPASVVGTALDATTGKALAKVRIEAPGGQTATSDKDGRFELKGLAAGTSGTLRATLADGRSAQVSLRPLAAGSTLEVVLHLR